MKKLVMVLASAGALLLVATGCGKSSTPSSGGLSVVSGQYIVPENASYSQTQNGKGYLALKVKLKNEGSSSDYVTDDSFKLTTKNGDTIDSKSDYDSESDFETISTKLDRGDTTTGYIVFPVKKNQTYTLKYTSDVSKSKTSKVTIDTSNYKDRTGSAKKALQAYINTVFLGKNEGQFSKLLTNSKSDGETDFTDEVKDNLDDVFYNATLDDDETSKFITALKAANKDRSSAKITVESSTPTAVIFTVKPTVIDLSDVSDIIENKAEDAEDANLEGDYDTIQLQSYQDSLNSISDIFKQAKMDTQSTGETVKVEKDGNKWKIDTEGNDSVKELMDEYAQSY